MGHPKFSVTTAKNGKFRFNLTAKNGQVILASQSYTTKASCLNGVDSVKKNAADENMFEVSRSKDDQHYFNLKSSNGQIIGTSEMYTTAAACKNGIKSVMTNAPIAEPEEE